MMCVYLLSIALVFVSVNAGYDINENFDMDAVVSNPVAMKEFVGCFMDTVPCSPDVEAFKKVTPDAVATGCAKCSRAHKIMSQKFLGALAKDYPEEFAAFKKKIDPEGKYFEALQAGIAKV